MRMDCHRPPRRHCLRRLGAAGLVAAWPAARAQAQASAPASANAGPPITDLNEAVNQAGRQRMLSQRLAKTWLALGQQIQPARANKVQAESSALFSRQLLALQAFAPTAQLRNTYRALGQAWTLYAQGLASLEPTAANTARLLALDNAVLALAHQGATELEALAAQAVTRWVNLAGRQRMLSQRMAKYYLVQRWPAGVFDAARLGASASHEFVAALSQLHDAPEATPTIREQLRLGQQQWVFFANALAKLDPNQPNQPNPRHAVEVFDSSENLLLVMDRVAGLYARLGAG